MVSPSANPLLQNDPLLVLFARLFQLSPFEFALLGFVSLPMVLLVWSTLSGTLHRKGNLTQGFLSWINAYLLIIPILDFEIFEYYKVYANKIEELIKVGFLQEPQIGMFHFFATRRAERLSIGFIVVSLGIAMIAIGWPRMRQKPQTTWLWLSKEKKIRWISYYFYIVLFGVHGSILLNWLLRHIAIWTALNKALNVEANTYNPDKMFGLSALADLIWYSYGVLLTTTVLLAVWLIGAKLTNRREQMHRHPGEVAAVVVLLIAGPLGFLAPLLGSHARMTAAKEHEQSALIDKVKSVSEEIRSSGPMMTAADLGSKVAVLNAEQQLYKFVEECSTWPISVGMVSALLGFLNPVLLLLLKKFVPGLPELPEGSEK
jgi:hypothetical protein